jgi:hypothetical protein
MRTRDQPRPCPSGGTFCDRASMTLQTFDICATLMDPGTSPVAGAWPTVAYRSGMLVWRGSAAKLGDWLHSQGDPADEWIEDEGPLG